MYKKITLFVILLLLGGLVLGYIISFDFSKGSVTPITEDDTAIVMLPSEPMDQNAYELYNLTYERTASQTETLADIAKECMSNYDGSMDHIINCKQYCDMRVTLLEDSEPQWLKYVCYDHIITIKDNQ